MLTEQPDTTELYAEPIPLLVGWIYGLTMRGDWISRIVATIWFRWYCPYPIGKNWTARQCIEAGNCGCNNKRSLTR